MMAVVDEVRAEQTARGLRIKRNNAITAALTGGALALLSAKLYGFALAPIGFGLGIAAGLVYANVFEYVLHRFLLHWGEGYLDKCHGMHHETVGAADEARYVNFATSPLVVMFLFLVNAPAAFAIESLLHEGMVTGMLVGFTLYYIAYEEVHWRIHLGGWLPSWLRFARRHHMLHHADFKGRYNVFLPLCDWIFERREWKATAGGSAAHPPNR
jgi:hypothetical protein